MMFFKMKEKSELDLLESRFKNVTIWDKNKIKKNYDKRLPVLTATLTGVISKFPSIGFLILFWEKNKRRSWYSEVQGKVIINVVFDPRSPEFNRESQKAIKDFQLIELGIEL